jgi:CheY-like chemotaxis protein
LPIVSEPKVNAKRVLSVGQCFADHSALSRMLRSSFGADVIAAGSQAEALELVRRESFALVLVNRVFDADGSSGLELIRAIKADPARNGVPVMLVSNYDDAQAQAMQAGAVRGFGKAALGQPQVLALMELYLR